MTARPAPRLPHKSAAEISAELRNSFVESLYRVTGSQAGPDPVLTAMFEALAVQFDRIYQEADQVFFGAALDDLIRGLGMPARLARPAQAVVQFSQLSARETISPEIELIGYQASGEPVAFAPDATIDIAPVDLVFAGIAEGGRLTTLGGARLPWVNQPLLPGMSSPVALSSAAPTLFLAFETDPAHLSRIGLFVETASPTSTLPGILARSPWQLLDNGGRVSERGVLRAARTRGGMRQLAFLGDLRPRIETAGAASVVPLVGGVVGDAVWLFPDIPSERRWQSRVPPAIADAVPRLMPVGHEKALDRPLVWLQVPLPAGTRAVASQITRFAVNCVTASNIEVWSEQIDFPRLGNVVSHRPSSAADRHVLGVLSVVGETGDPYSEVSDLETAPGSGRFRYLGGGRFEFAPARQPSGRFDLYTMLRILYCDGDSANGIAAGKLEQIRSELPKNPLARVANLTPSKGGANPPEYPEARLRFAEQLRTRERVVTAADVEIAVRATEPRVHDVRVASVSEITAVGLGLVTMVTAVVAPEDFADPDAELERLRTELEAYLSERCMIGQRIQVIVERRTNR